MSDPICLLAIEEKPNSYLPFAINDLGITYPAPVNTLMEMDLFLSIIDQEKIKATLEEVNIFPEEALSGKLVILYIDENGIKRKLPIIPKDYYNNYNLLETLQNNSNDAQFINYILNKINNLQNFEEVRENLKAAIKTSDFELFMSIYSTLPYFVQRGIYLYIIAGLEKSLRPIREKKEVG